MKSIVARLWSKVVEASTSTLSKPDSQPVEPGVAARTPDLSASVTVYAGFWRRLGALLVDGLIFLPISATVTWASAQSRLAALLLLLPAALLGCAYQVYFHARWGQTPGKMVARVRVLSLDGTRIGIRQALLRSAVDTFLAGLVVAAHASALLRIPAAEYALLGWLEQNQRLAEVMAQWPWLSWIQAAWAISEVVTMLFNRRRRALHDLIAGTLVVRVGREAAVHGLAAA